ncbi:MAG: hypothetical protein IJS61_00140 [Firmicutes bacterium]|nr:hypothetical protein [Bacillota bacterium]
MVREFINDENGLATIEVAILTAILVALAILFRKQLSGLWNKTADEMQNMEDKIGK